MNERQYQPNATVRIVTMFPHHNRTRAERHRDVAIHPTITPKTINRSWTVTSIPHGRAIHTDLPDYQTARHAAALALYAGIPKAPRSLRAYRQWIRDYWRTHTLAQIRAIATLRHLNMPTTFCLRQCTRRRGLSYTSRPRATHPEY